MQMMLLPFSDIFCITNSPKFAATRKYTTQLSFHTWGCLNDPPTAARPGLHVDTCCRSCRNADGHPFRNPNQGSKHEHCVHLKLRVAKQVKELLQAVGAEAALAGSACDSTTSHRQQLAASPPSSQQSCPHTSKE